ncbi:uncharacterized protein METZ01_LOCUS85810, partial [marine metagenome]
VADRAVIDQFRNLPERHEPGDQVLTGVELGVVPADGVADDDRVHLVVHDRRVGVYESSALGYVAGVAGFLAQLARCRFHWAFAGIDHSAGQFQFDEVGSLPVLLNHYQLIVRRQGDDVAPVHRLDHKK